MKLHFRGIQVPALGSPRDKVYRDFLINESKIEAKKHQMLLLMTMGSAAIMDSHRSDWDRQAKQVFDEYISLMFGQEVTPRMREEAEMLKFYQEKIAKSSPVITGSSSKGNLSVTNLPKF